MLSKAVLRTTEYISAMPKVERKKLGQFFTSKETAEFMAGMFNIPDDKTEVSFLDPGAGSGILSCAVLERLKGIPSIKKVLLTCYENDATVLPLLKANLQECKNNMAIDFEYTIIQDNYVISQSDDFNNTLIRKSTLCKYDYVIGNPPYMKILRDAAEAMAMPTICYGAPNLYFLFAAMSLFNLRDGGEMVYIFPRSWTSGAYFKKFRQYLLTEGRLFHIHLFNSRNKVFEKERVLQETIIVRIKKTSATPNNILVTSSQSNSDFANIRSMEVPYDIVVSGNDFYVYLVTDQEEVSVLNKLHSFKKTLPDIGLKMKTGLTVDFRNRETLRNDYEEGAVPLFYAHHIKKGHVTFPIQKRSEYIVTDKSGLLQENRNYLFVKRFTSKEEARRLQCGVYLAKEFHQYQMISTQNKINFIDGLRKALSECVVYGLYVILNSSLYDSYYRILNGSTQVNSTEINSMPVPDFECIQAMGKELMTSMDLSEQNCNAILEGYCGQC